MVLHFYNTFLNLSDISSLFSSGTIISSTGSSLIVLSSLGLVTASAVLFPKNSLGYFFGRYF